MYPEISITSYVKCGNEFVDIESCTLTQFRNAYRSDAIIEGAIELVIFGKQLLTLAEWDCIGELWSYWTTSLEVYLSGEDASFSFPDQPISIALVHRSGGREIELRVQTETERRIIASSDLVIPELIKAASRFFERIRELHPRDEGQYVIELQRLKMMRSQGSMIDGKDQDD